MLKTHVIVDFYMADAEILARTDKLKAAIDRALDSLDHEVVQESYIQFEPIGVTATVVGKMFHFSIHTWPEHGSCAIDIYSLEDKNLLRSIASALRDSFSAQEYDIKILDRDKPAKI
ncbi:MAG: S-adenosylmethionine decarboxylase [Candidatus Caenarcaniphilales bacterium]|jgi:S-adenosylmethionine decarboxylase|nr:S-adenosylmethionine decarboxylase [Candidatus Caenarcaniphilales bacterium]